jgi:hypothetical protein
MQGRLDRLSDDEGAQFLAALRDFSEKTAPQEPIPVTVLPRPDASNAHALPQRLDTRAKIRKQQKERKRQRKERCRPPATPPRATESDSENDPDKDDFVPPKKSLLHSNQIHRSIVSTNGQKSTNSTDSTKVSSNRHFLSILKENVSNIFNRNREARIDEANQLISGIIIIFAPVFINA